MTLDLLKLRIWQIVAFASPAATLAINPWTNLDPISVVKMLCVVIAAFSVLGIILTNRNFFLEELPKSFKLSSLAFLLALASTFIFSGAPLDQQFWGYFGRNTGVLTYFSFLVLMLGAILVEDAGLYKRLEFSLIAVSIPVAAYCLVQMSGNDPVGWSQFATFATLGNVNFLSGFLGLVCVSIFPRLMDRQVELSRKLLLGLLLVLHLVIIQSTSSIQGLIIFAFGAWTTLMIRLRTTKKSFINQTLLLLVGFFSACIGAMGLTNRGPLASLLYQPSNILRADYMHAGWQMTTDHPLFGVGLDSYGDWYRQARGQITTLRGSADRNSNAAHSVFLDISSNGGFPLLIAYLLILGVIAATALRAYKKLGKRYDVVFTCLASTWIAFHFQALISINQIGVAVWGWTIGGALFGYSRLIINESSGVKKIETRKLKGKPIPAATSVFTIVGAFLGLVLAGIPQQADSKYFAATKTQQVEKISRAASALGSTAWHRNLAIDSALSAQNNQLALELANQAQKDYPRSFWPWKVSYLLPESPVAKRDEALSVLRKMDPFNPEFK